MRHLYENYNDVIVYGRDFSLQPRQKRQLSISYTYHANERINERVVMKKRIKKCIRSRARTYQHGDVTKYSNDDLIVIAKGSRANPIIITVYKK